jgi:hypothetical protein
MYVFVLAAELSDSFISEQLIAKVALRDGLDPPVVARRSP